MLNRAKLVIEQTYIRSLRQSMGQDLIAIERLEAAGLSKAPETYIDEHPQKEVLPLKVCTMHSEAIEIPKHTTKRGRVNHFRHSSNGDRTQSRIP